MLDAGSMTRLARIGLFAVIAIAFAVRAATRSAARLPVIGYALVAGGALGNAIDRVRMGSVTDFVRWSLRAHVWPIFNVADVALVIGIVLVAFGHLRRGAIRPRNPRREPATRSHMTG